MMFVAPEVAPPVARWATRAVFFALGLVAAAIFLHRLFNMPTAIAVNIVATSFACAALGLVLAAIAAVQIWRRGGPGTARVVTAVAVSLGLVGWPIAFVPTALSLPAINDVSTDTAAPPAFEELAAQRGRGHTAYPARFAAQQAAAYPDIVPITVGRSNEEAFELVMQALRLQKVTVVREQPPAGPGATVIIEAIDRTLVFGFYDDVVVRVTGDGSQARIDVRSASRFGRHDLGRNAERVRRILKTIVARLEATVPTVTGERVGWQKRSKHGLRPLNKRQKGSDQATRGAGKPGSHARGDARRGPGQKVPQPSQDDRRSRGKRPAQSFE